MTHHLANAIPTRLLMWQRVREYAVPLSMIETATARRAAGDWAGACAAARVDVDLDPVERLAAVVGIADRADRSVERAVAKPVQGARR